MNSRFIGFVLLLVCIVSTGVAADTSIINPLDPPAGRFSDEWAEIYLAGMKIGYAHSTVGRKGELIHSSSTMNMQIGRVDQPVKLSIIERAVEAVDGTPVSFETVQDLSVMKTSTKGTVKDGKVTIVTSQYGMEQTQTYDYPAGAMLKTWGMFRESLLRGFEPGTEYELALYEPAFSVNGTVKTITTIGDWEEFEHKGQKRRGIKATVTMQSPAGELTMVSWVGKNGIPIKAKMPAAGLGDLEILATDQATAMADFMPPELFMTTVVKVNKSIDAERANRIRYRVVAKNGDVDLSTLPSSGMQSVGKVADGAAEVVVTRQIHKPQSKAKPPKSDVSEYLDGNLMINIDDPQLIALSKRAGGGLTEPFALADRLRRFVTEYVQTKSLNVGFGTASEVCRTKEGDCTEHGVLLAALGRLNGLPSRVAVGLAYLRQFGGQRDVFGYHMWTQFWIDGRWVDFDAALRESECSPTRIAFATSSLKNSGLADLSLPLISAIGGINIEIHEVEKRP
ncbi:MAG: transglutaminase domain-containing protein [Phycisphaerales bacterium]|nr:MAG: transglutaminase domain-containing protein [Phycisphaerales bacterium]